MIKVDSVVVDVEYFPDGTPRLNLNIPLGHVNIEWLYEPNEEMILYYIVKHIKNGVRPPLIDLYLPYIPNARMDRVKNQDLEIFTLKYFCDFINSLGFENVIVRDAHSNVSLGLLDRVISEYYFDDINNLINELINPEGDILFYPDEGAYKRYSEEIKFPYAFGIKNRNWEDGKIISLDVHGKIPSEPFNVLIIDDICSYGGTFLHSARKLKELGANKIFLYISHCENSILKGELINSNLIEKIYTTRSIFTETHPLIKIIGESL